MRIWPGSASPGRAGAPAERALRRLSRRAGAARREGLVYPSFESRAEIAARVAERDAAAMAARSRRRAALSRSAAALDAAERAARAWRRASPMRCASTWRRRSRARAARLGRDRRRTRGRNRHRRRRPAALGRRHPGRKETPTSYHLSVVVDDARQGMTARGARPGPVLVDQRASPVAGAARFAGADLSPPSAHSRCRGTKALEVDPRDRVARAARAGATTAADIRRLVGL